MWSSWTFSKNNDWYESGLIYSLECGGSSINKENKQQMKCNDVCNIAQSSFAHKEGNKKNYFYLIN